MRTLLSDLLASSSSGIRGAIRHSLVCALSLQIFRTALDSGEYVHIRNSLIILNKIVKVCTAPSRK